MKRSDLRARVRLEAPVILDGAWTWTPRGSVWAAIAPASKLTSAVVAYDVVIRARDDVKEGWRAVWGERALRVTAVAARSDAPDRICLSCQQEA